MLAPQRAGGPPCGRAGEGGEGKVLAAPLTLLTSSVLLTTVVLTPAVFSFDRTPSELRPVSLRARRNRRAVLQLPPQSSPSFLEGLSETNISLRRCLSQETAASDALSGANISLRRCLQHRSSHPQGCRSCSPDMALAETP